MELSKEQLDFLIECEQEFKDRYTDKDEDFLKVTLSATTNPPIVDHWPHRQRHRGDDTDDRYYYRERYREGRSKKKRHRSRRHKERSRDTKRSEYKRRTSDQKRHKDRKSENEHRKHNKKSSYRSERNDEDRNSGCKDSGRRKNRDKYRKKERSTGSQDKSRRYIDEKPINEIKSNAKKDQNDNKSEEILKETCESVNYHRVEQDIYSMYVIKHYLYENYRPYF